MSDEVFESLCKLGRQYNLSYLRCDQIEIKFNQEATEAPQVIPTSFMNGGMPPDDKMILASTPFFEEDEDIVK